MAAPVPNAMLLNASAVVRGQRARAPAVDPSDYMPTPSVANAINDYSGYAGMGLFFGAPLLGGLIGGVEKMGTWLSKHLPVIGNPIAKSAAYMGKPFAFLNKSMGDVAPGAAAILDKSEAPLLAATKSFNNATGFLSSRASALIGKADRHAFKAYGLAQELHAGATHLPAGLAQKILPLSGLVSTAISSGDVKSLTDHVDGIAMLARQTGHKPLAKQASKINTLVGHAVKAKATAEVLEKAALGKEATSVAQQTVGHTAANLVFLAGGAASAYLTAKDIYSDTRAYADMVADLTGKPARALGMFDLFMGELPYAAKVARNSMLINAGPRTLAEAANTVLNIKQLKGGFNWKLIAGAMALPMMSQGVGLLTGGNILDAYKELKRNELQGLENTPEGYANLLGIASEELNKAGGANANFTRAIADSYAAQHLSVHEVMQRIGNGQLLKDLHAVQAQYVQEHQTQEHSVSHVDRLQKKAEIPEISKPKREMLGEHTKQVMHQAPPSSEVRAV